MKLADTSVAKVVSAVDLFCGAGGLTHGLEKSGIAVNLGINIDPAEGIQKKAQNRQRGCW